jgi:hypothetical protein
MVQNLGSMFGRQASHRFLSSTMIFSNSIDGFEKSAAHRSIDLEDSALNGERLLGV